MNKGQREKCLDFRWGQVGRIVKSLLKSENGCIFLSGCLLGQGPIAQRCASSAAFCCWQPLQCAFRRREAALEIVMDQIGRHASQRVNLPPCNTFFSGCESVAADIETGLCCVQNVVKGSQSPLAIE